MLLCVMYLPCSLLFCHFPHNVFMDFFHSFLIILHAGIRLGELQMSFQSECSCHPELVFTPYFLNIVVEVKALELPHTLKMWLW